MCNKLPIYLSHCHYDDRTSKQLQPVPRPPQSGRCPRTDAISYYILTHGVSHYAFESDSYIHVTNGRQSKWKKAHHSNQSRSSRSRLFPLRPCMRTFRTTKKKHAVPRTRQLFKLYDESTSALETAYRPDRLQHSRIDIFLLLSMQNDVANTYLT